MCPHCGKFSSERNALADVACYMAAIQVYKDSIRCNKEGAVISADAVEAAL